MNFPAGLFSDTWTLGAYLPFAVIWLWCARTAPWPRLAEPSQLNVWLGTIVVLMLFWSMNAGVQPGLNMHLLGATAFTLMFGRQLAIIGLSIVLVATMINGGANAAAAWQPFALNALVMVALPCFATHALLRFTERFLPANLFVYVFAAFFDAALVAVAAGVAATLLLWLAHVYPAHKLFADYFPYFILLGFAEAWLNGVAITLMVVYYPSWVGSFDDSRYLTRK